jgi:hypothetical protein
MRFFGIGNYVGFGQKIAAAADPGLLLQPATAVVTTTAPTAVQVFDRPELVSDPVVSDPVVAPVDRSIYAAPAPAPAPSVATLAPTKSHYMTLAPTMEAAVAPRVLAPSAPPPPPPSAPAAPRPPAPGAPEPYTPPAAPPPPPTTPPTPDAPLPPVPGVITQQPAPYDPTTAALNQLAVQQALQQAMQTPEGQAALIKEQLTKIKTQTKLQKPVPGMPAGTPTPDVPMPKAPSILPLVAGAGALALLLLR